MARRTIADTLRDPLWATIIGILALIVAILSAPFISRLYSPSPAKPDSTPQATIVPSPISGKATPTLVPSPVATPTMASTPSPSPTPTSCLQPQASTPTPTPVGTTSSSVTAVVTEQKCLSATFPVIWVYGFYTGGAYNEVGSVLSAESFASFGGGYMGAISLLDISPQSAYNGPSLYAWLYQLGEGYAIVISNTFTQPTGQQLGHAYQSSGYVDMEGGAYLPQNFKLTSTVPQSRGYQFNLVVQKS